ncbi:MAG: glycoside hydrolase family 18 protein [Anaerolineae bacterium]|nr:glycoside hydrolase family 18 protein [Anaerolineae bacterium]
MTAQDAPSYRIVGYFTAWAIYGRQYFVSDIPADKLTHINYAFANISEEGECLLGDEWADTQIAFEGDAADSPLLGSFNQLNRLKDAHPHLQTLISVGGWSWSARFSDAALTEESRRTFAASCVDFMKRYGFDGIDIDWEYPTGGGNTGNVERPADRDNFVLLLAELRAQLDALGEQDGRAYLLTIAASASERGYLPLDWSRIHPLLDWINVMTYDMSGGWSSRTGFNAPLYHSTGEGRTPPEGSSTDAALQGYLAQGVPPEKLVMGVPFYGRGWAGVPAANDGLHQPFTRLPDGTWEPGAFEYGDLAANYVGSAAYQRFWNETAQVPWLYNADEGIMISYDDPESLAIKAEYVRQNHLGGVMFWELSHDSADAALLNAIYETLSAPG